MTAMRLRFLNSLSLTIALMVLAVGCGKRGPEIAPVEGMVTFQDKPLASANVMFTPKEGGRPATGTTDEQGQFQLTTFQKSDGAIVGEYDVIITKIAPATANPAFNGSPNDPKGLRTPSFLDAQPAVRKSLIPDRYGKPQISGLSAKVVSGRNTLAFRLTP